MKRLVYEPNEKRLSKVFPYVAEVPKGYRTLLSTICRERLGRSYYRWAPTWQRQWIKGYRHHIGYSQGPWVIDEDAVWQYRDGKLYAKEEATLGMVLIAMLSKKGKTK